MGFQLANVGLTTFLRFVLKFHDLAAARRRLARPTTRD
jgi:hypothetical protein